MYIHMYMYTHTYIYHIYVYTTHLYHIYIHTTQYRYTVHVFKRNRVTRLFVSVFLFKQLLLVPVGTSSNDFEFFRIFMELFVFVIDSPFEFFRIFMELFVFVIDSPVMNTPGSLDSPAVTAPETRLRIRITPRLFKKSRNPC